MRLHHIPKARIVVENRVLHVLGVDGEVALREGVADVVELAMPMPMPRDNKPSQGKDYE